MKNLYFIINPQAGNGYCQKVWVKVEKELKFQQIPYLAFFSEYRGHVKEISRKIAQKANGEEIIIVAVGGDGTFNEMLNGAVQFENVSFGFIPGGSGNDFTKGFHIPESPLGALKVLLRQIKRDSVTVDVGRMSDSENQEQYFINSMGAGFDALISLEANQSRLKRILNRMFLGRFIYPVLILKNLFHYNCTDVQLIIDGRSFVFKHTWFVTVSNQPFYGGGMKISPDAVSDDGIFNITVVHKLSKIKLLLVFICVFWGGHTSFKEVRTFKGKSISINSSSPIYTHVDGECKGKTPVKIDVCHRALPILSRGTDKVDVATKEWRSHDRH